MISSYFLLACTSDDSIDTQRAEKNILLDIPEISLDESIIEEIEMIRQRSAIPAIGVVLAVKERGIWAQGFGMSDVEQQLPVSKDTPFMLASISKTFVATAILQLREEGLLDLQDSVHEQISFPLDNPHLPSERIEVRHLVTHTSSIVDNWSVWGDPGGNGVLVDGDSSIPLGDFLEGYLVEGGNWYSAEDNWSENTPGTSYDYSNIGSALAGLLVEETTGVPLREHSKKHLSNNFPTSCTSCARAVLVSELPRPGQDQGVLQILVALAEVPKHKSRHPPATDPLLSAFGRARLVSGVTHHQKKNK